MPHHLDRPGLPRLAYERREGAGPTVLFLPGYGSDMAGAKAQALDAWAADRGRALLRLDYRGCGGSAGVFGEATLDDWLDDVLDVVDGLTGGPLVLVGSSMGGWLMLLAALARPERVRALVGVAAAPDFTEWGFDDAQRAALRADGLVVVGDDDAPQVVTRPFWDSGQRNRLLEGPIAFDGAVRLLHGLEDRVVPPSVAFRLGRALRSADVQTVLVKGGDHRLSGANELRVLTATLSALIDTP